MERRWLFILFFMLSVMAQGGVAKTIEVEVHGLTCAFCVDSLERRLSEIPTVSKVQVSLKNKKVRIETTAEAPNMEAIKQTILDAGFTPVTVTVLSDEESGE